MSDLKTDKRLARARDASQQDQAPRLRLCRLVNDLGDAANGGFRGGGGPMNARKVAMLEQRPRGFDEAWQGTIGIRRQEAAWDDDRVRVVNVKLLGEASLRRSRAMDPGVRADVPRRFRQHDRAVHGPIGALAVIRPQVTDVTGGLIDVGPIGVAATLEFQNKDGATHQEHDVWTAVLERKLVLEDGGVVRGDRVLEEDLADLTLQWRDG